MGEPEDMTIHLLNEVLDEFNVTYKASKKKADLIVKVHQAQENLQNTENFQHYTEVSLHFRMSHENRDKPGKSHWYNRFTFSVTPFPVIY